MMDELAETVGNSGWLGDRDVFLLDVLRPTVQRFHSIMHRKILPALHTTEHPNVRIIPSKAIINNCQSSQAVQDSGDLGSHPCTTAPWCRKSTTARFTRIVACNNSRDCLPQTVNRLGILKPSGVGSHYFRRSAYSTAFLARVCGDRGNYMSSAHLIGRTMHEPLLLEALVRDAFGL